MSWADERYSDIDYRTNGDDLDELPFLDWHELFTEQTSDEEWLFDGVFAIGRGHALYAKHKQGKSLFTLWCCAELATRTDVDVIYLDYEMTRADVRERMEDMGYGDDSDLRSHYDLLPTQPPLDTGEGMAAVLRLVYQVQRPDCHVMVVVDTTGRAAQGKENDADTFRDFYKWTGIALKRRGVTWARLDHAGKDEALGQRGSSGKGDDVDVIWKLVAGDNGMTLHRDAARMPWVEEKLSFAIRSDPLRYERSGALWPAGTKELVAQLDQLGLPPDIGRRKARQALKDNGLSAPATVLAAALRWRKQNLLNVSDLTADTQKVKSTALETDTPDTSLKPHVTGADTSADTYGHTTGVNGHVSVSLDTDTCTTDRDDGLVGSLDDPVPTPEEIDTLTRALVCIRCGGPPDHPSTLNQPCPGDPDERF
jgi:hypothetical protein